MEVGHYGSFMKRCMFWLGVIIELSIDTHNHLRMTSLRLTQHPPLIGSYLSWITLLTWLSIYVNAITISFPYLYLTVHRYPFTYCPMSNWAKGNSRPRDLNRIDRKLNVCLGFYNWSFLNLFYCSVSLVTNTLNFPSLVQTTIQSVCQLNLILRIWSLQSCKIIYWRSYLVFVEKILTVDALNEVVATRTPV